MVWRTHGPEGKYLCSLFEKGLADPDKTDPKYLKTIFEKHSKFNLVVNTSNFYKHYRNVANIWRENKNKSGARRSKKEKDEEVLDNNDEGDLEEEEEEELVLDEEEFDIIDEDIDQLSDNFKDLDMKKAAAKTPPRKKAPPAVDTPTSNNQADILVKKVKCERNVMMNRWADGSGTDHLTVELPVSMGVAPSDLRIQVIKNGWVLSVAWPVAARLYEPERLKVSSGGLIKSSDAKYVGLTKSVQEHMEGKPQEEVPMEQTYIPLPIAVQDKFIKTNDHDDGYGIEYHNNTNHDLREDMQHFGWVYIELIGQPAKALRKASRSNRVQVILSPDEIANRRRGTTRQHEGDTAAGAEDASQYASPQSRARAGDPLSPGNMSIY